jgi:hypothetical protein
MEEIREEATQKIHIALITRKWAVELVTFNVITVYT